MRRAVDLPQPDGPTSTRNSASWASIVRLLTASTSPYCLVTCSRSTLVKRLSSPSSVLSAVASRGLVDEAHAATVQGALDIPRDLVRLPLAWWQWHMYRHDQSGTTFNPDDTTLSPGYVEKLVSRWQQDIHKGKSYLSASVP